MSFLGLNVYMARTSFHNKTIYVHIRNKNLVWYKGSGQTQPHAPVSQTITREPETHHRREEFDARNVRRNSPWGAGHLSVDRQRSPACSVVQKNCLLWWVSFETFDMGYRNSLRIRIAESQGACNDLAKGILCIYLGLFYADIVSLRFVFWLFYKLLGCYPKSIHHLH